MIICYTTLSFLGDQCFLDRANSIADATHKMVVAGVEAVGQLEDEAAQEALKQTVEHLQ